MAELIKFTAEVEVTGADSTMSYASTARDSNFTMPCMMAVAVKIFLFVCRFIIPCPGKFAFPDGESRIGKFINCVEYCAVNRVVWCAACMTLTHRGAIYAA